VKQRYSLYLPELSLIAETATSTATNPPIAYEYVWFDGEPLAPVETATNTVHWYFDGHLGAPILTTGATGGVDWRVEREPYGTTYLRAGARYQPLGLPGQEQHQDDGERHYNIFRWYRAGWGRYAEADPVHGPRVFLKTGAVILPSANPDGDQYTYTGGNPIRFVDPDGQYTRPCSIADLNNCQSDCDKIGKRLVGCGCYGVPFCFGLLNYSIAECKDYQKGCPACPPPPGPRIDRVPPHGLQVNILVAPAITGIGSVWTKDHHLRVFAGTQRSWGAVCEQLASE